MAAFMSDFVFHLLVCSLLTGYLVRGEKIIIGTPESTSYYILLTKEIAFQQTFYFEVKSCRDVNVALINGNTENDTQYEIVLGGFNNKVSLIKPFKQNVAMATYNHTILDCNQFTTFAVHWNTTTINVKSGKGYTSYSIMAIKTTLRNVRAIGIKTTLGAIGDWRLFHDPGRSFHINTPNLQKYIILKNLYNLQLGFVKFKVRACRDVYIALIDGDTDSDPLYEIVLGEWANIQSVIRTHQQQVPPVSSVNRSSLHCHQFKTFMIRWNDFKIEVLNYIHHRFAIHISWTSPVKLNTIQNIGIYTGFGATGEWKMRETVSDDDDFTMWSTWGTCSRSCGGGGQFSTRSCTVPWFQSSPPICVGASKMFQACNTNICKNTAKGHFSSCNISDTRAVTTPAVQKMVRSSPTCATTCSFHNECVGFNYYEDTNTCELVSSSGMKFITAANWTFFRKCSSGMGDCPGCYL